MAELVAEIAANTEAGVGVVVLLAAADAGAPEDGALVDGVFSDGEDELGVVLDLDAGCEEAALDVDEASFHGFQHLVFPELAANYAVGFFLFL